MNPKVDAYIAKAAEFAQPILEHLRAMVHKACPEVEETIKWSMPFFEFRGVILCNMAAFKEHCSFGFWGEEIGAVLREAGIAKKDGMGSLGRIKSGKDLPSDKVLTGWIQQAAGFVERGEYTSPRKVRRLVVKDVGKEQKPELELPTKFASALKKNKNAAAVFEGFTPGSKREYAEWINEAKREETREKRVASAIEWIAEGKKLNWRYGAR